MPHDILFENIVSFSFSHVLISARVLHDILDHVYSTALGSLVQV